MRAPRLTRDHPDRIALANELHARPFAMLRPPFRISHVALACSPAEQGKATAHLRGLCARFGAPLPDEGAPHVLADFGRFRVKWERHSEFVAFTVIAGPGGPGAAPFADPAITLLPEDWAEGASGPVLAAAHIHAEAVEAPIERAGAIPGRFKAEFVRESLLGGAVFDDQARFWGDFRIHEDGFMRFVIMASPTLDEALMGRLVQRLMEVETYRAAAMLALPAARGLWPDLNAIDAALAEATAEIGAEHGAGERAVLDRITELSARIETATAANAFRLDAARAYSTIVWRRIDAVDAQPLPGLLNLKGFMLRRFEPAMRSCEATSARLDTLSRRATRAATLLRTRIDVALEEQNRELLASMDARSATQLRLQETVEGFSVVALSYYAVSLAALALSPFAKEAGLSPAWTKALLVPPMILLVWLFIRRVKRHALKRSE